MEEFNVPLDDYPRRCEAQIVEWQELRDSLGDGVTPVTTRSNEYGARIVHAFETGEPFACNGSVMNDGLIDNLSECYHAAMFDPHTAAELSLADIHELVDRLLEAHGGLVPALA